MANLRVIESFSSAIYGIEQDFVVPIDRPVQHKA
jgi:hypothetical protein